MHAASSLHKSLPHTPTRCQQVIEIHLGQSRVNAAEPHPAPYSLPKPLVGRAQHRLVAVPELVGHVSCVLLSLTLPVFVELPVHGLHLTHLFRELFFQTLILQASAGAAKVKTGVLRLIAHNIA